MSLLKPRVMTPARVEPSRRNALKSAGARTARGKAQSSLNGLRHGFCSPTYNQFWLALFEAPPGFPVARIVQTLLTPEETCHPVYADLIDVHYGMELEDQASSRRIRRQRERMALRDLKRSREDTENNRSSDNQTSAKPSSL
jgi:hypothetical protein